VLAATHTLTYETVNSEDSAGEAVRKVIRSDIKALEDTLTILDLPALQRAAETLLAARRVDIYGSGGAAIAALELQYKLIRVGVRPVVHTDPEMQVISATLLTAADAAVGISHSGESRDVRQALSVAKASGAKTLAITNHPASPISELVDISLCTAAQEALAHGYPLGARVAQVALIDVLYSIMAMKRPDESTRNLTRIAEVLHLSRD
jgi:DNA-binding MurR/RpiR family transcriptional regulator